MKILNVTYKILILFAVCCMTGCAATRSGTETASNQQQAALQDAERLLHLSTQSKDQVANNYRLQAIEQLIAANNIEKAEHALQQSFPIKLDSNNTAYKNILSAQVALAKHNLLEAKQYLRSIWTPLQLPEPLLIKFYTTRAETYRRSGELLDSIQERIYLSLHLKSAAEIKANNDNIWGTLSQLTPRTLKSFRKKNNRDVLNGWLEFAGITKQYDASSEQLIRALATWQEEYPNHPAFMYMPKPTTTRITAQSLPMVDKKLHKPKKIALMLPLRGTHAKSAQAIRDGFLAAYYDNSDKYHKPTIQVYDTTTEENLYNLYKQIIADGAEFIVGPLTKEEVEAINDNTRPLVPILALNNTVAGGGQHNIYQFSLSPEMEAQAVAKKAWDDGRRNAIIIIPKSAWGQRMLTAFQDAWGSLGGNIIGVEEVQNQANLTKAVKKILAIDSSEARAQQLKESGLKFAFDPRRRQDIDMIFIATNAALARQVKPILNFYFAADVPAYASSSIFTGKIQPTLDQDLNGILFCDMPWLLDGAISSKGTYQAVAELWPDDFAQYSRLYALGLDAYKIANQIDQLTLLPDLGISGMTGMLTLDKQRNINRKMMWAAFKKGIPSVSGDQL